MIYNTWGEDMMIRCALEELGKTTGAGMHRENTRKYILELFHFSEVCRY